MSSSYKSAAFRFHQQPDQAVGEFKYRPQVQQLQDIFPDFSVQGTSRPRCSCSPSPLSPDLSSLLLEVGGDVQLAAQRISEGLPFPSFFSTLSIAHYHRSCRAVGLREKQKREKTSRRLPPKLKGPPSLSRSHRLARRSRWAWWSRRSNKRSPRSRLSTQWVRGQRACLTRFTSRKNLLTGPGFRRQATRRGLFRPFPTRQV